jgi:hypothetical protein
MCIAADALWLPRRGLMAAHAMLHHLHQQGARITMPLLFGWVGGVGAWRWQCRATDTVCSTVQLVGALQPFCTQKANGRSTRGADHHWITRRVGYMTVQAILLVKSKGKENTSALQRGPRSAISGVHGQPSALKISQACMHAMCRVLRRR